MNKVYFLKLFQSFIELGHEAFQKWLIFTRTEAYKMNKVYFFKVFSSFRDVTHFFWSKDWKPFCKNCRWFKHTFLKKSSFFEFFSIWEENCVADIINRTIKCDLFAGKWCKDVSLGQTYLPTKVVFFQVLQHLRRKLCGRHH